MTLQELEGALKAADPDLPLLLETQSGPVGRSYHVTEFKLSRIDAIDCGGRLSSWTEATMQVLPSAEGEPMAAGKFKRILSKSLASIPELGEAELRVEHTPFGEGMQIFTLTRADQGQDAVTLKLAQTQSVCKPARDAQRIGAVAQPNRSARCCA